MVWLSFIRIRNRGRGIAPLVAPADFVLLDVLVEAQNPSRPERGHGEEDEHVREVAGRASDRLLVALHDR